MGPGRGVRLHPFAQQWNHNTHYYPLLESLIPASATRVLDIGCGDGTFCRFVAARGRSVTGVDNDLSVSPVGSSGVRFVAASGEALGLADGSFDAVTMTMVLHHMDAERALLEASRVLAPGGVLIILGYAGSGWRDLPHEVRDVLWHRVVSRRMTAWEPPTIKAEPTMSWHETRTVAAVCLPGCSYRRLPLWRYLVSWRRPLTGPEKFPTVVEHAFI